MQAVGEQEPPSLVELLSVAARFLALSMADPEASGPGSTVLRLPGNPAITTAYRCGMVQSASGVGPPAIDRRRAVGQV